MKTNFQIVEEFPKPKNPYTSSIDKILAKTLQIKKNPNPSTNPLNPSLTNLSLIKNKSNFEEVDEILNFNEIANFNYLYEYNQNDHIKVIHCDIIKE